MILWRNVLYAVQNYERKTHLKLLNHFFEAVVVAQISKRRFITAVVHQSILNNNISPMLNKKNKCKHFYLPDIRINIIIRILCFCFLLFFIFFLPNKRKITVISVIKRKYYKQKYFHIHIHHTLGKKC